MNTTLRTRQSPTTRRSFRRFCRTPSSWDESPETCRTSDTSRLPGVLRKLLDLLTTALFSKTAHMVRNHGVGPHSAFPTICCRIYRLNVSGPISPSSTTAAESPKWMTPTEAGQKLTSNISSIKNQRHLLGTVGINIASLFTWQNVQDAGINDGEIDSWRDTQE